MARLQEELTVADLKAAVLGAKLDPFLMGRDPRAGRRYDGIETLFRDRGQVERLIELYESRGPGGPREGADQGSIHNRAVVAWNQVLEAVRRVGAHRPPPRFKDPLVGNLVARWGWRNICLGDEVGDRIRFIEAYQELARRPRHD